MSRRRSFALITPDILLRAYAAGLFPMAESADDPGLIWVEPISRAVMPLDRFHLPRSLRSVVRQDRFEVRVDTAFDKVIDHCAGGGPSRPDTWINARIRRLFCAMFDLGHAHSVECWQEGRLVGGLYGLSLGSAFFGESMFHTATDASKVALVHLVARLRTGGYTLLDAQFQTTHLARFGTVEIERSTYRDMLDVAVAGSGRWDAYAGRMSVSGAEALAGLAERTIEAR